MPMISDSDLEVAIERGVLTRDQASALRALAQQRSDESPTPPGAAFTFLNVAHFFGALLVIGAMGFFITLGWESFGGAGIFFIALGHALAFVAAGRRVGRNPALRTPSGLLFTMALAMTPLVVYGFERWTGMWPDSDPGAYREFHQWVKGGWFAMELATVIVGIVAIRVVRFPFMTAIVAFVLWYMSMDLAPLLFGEHTAYDYVLVSHNTRCLVSAAVGAVMVLCAYLIDRRTEQDFAFWLYLFGLTAFWGGLSAMDSSSQLNKALYCLLNLWLIVLSVFPQRRVFVVYGALGVFGYIGYLSWHVFERSVAFPFVLSGIGLGILFGAVHVHKRRAELETAILDLIPSWLRGYMPRERARQA